MDVNTGIAWLGGAVASKDLLVKALGPTAEYFGTEMRSLVEKCNLNLNHVFAACLRKGGDDECAGVDPRVAKSVLENARFAEKELVQDYYGGLLCASKTGNEDDTAIAYLSVLNAMSSAQVLSHFLIYALMSKRSQEIGPITYEENRSRVVIVLTIDKFLTFLGRISEDQWEGTLNHVVGGLQRHGLISPFFQYGPPEHIEEKCPHLKGTVRSPSLVVTPTILGTELFLYAAGIKNPNPNWIQRSDLNLLSRFPKDLVEMLDR